MKTRIFDQFEESLFFFGRMRLKKRSEKTEIARPKRKLRKESLLTQNPEIAKPDGKGAAIHTRYIMVDFRIS